ncbi:hypothetical protein M011DRAFT_467729, partial [Sporormia fimetaria CBS 119925]
ICTSEPLRASTGVFSDLTLFRHTSPSFGSQHLCSYSNPSEHIHLQNSGGQSSNLNHVRQNVVYCAHHAPEGICNTADVVPRATARYKNTRKKSESFGVNANNPLGIDLVAGGVGAGCSHRLLGWVRKRILSAKIPWKRSRGWWCMVKTQA